MSRQFRARTQARFNAVQALYQLEHGDPKTPQVVVSEFVRHYLIDDQDHRADVSFFESLVVGAENAKGTIDPDINRVLVEPWSVERLDAVLRAILRVGFFELKSNLEVPKAIIINDYVEITKAFFEGREPGFINGALDKAAQFLREGDT